ncbi:N-acetylmuramoyl-L-alanine amidase [Lysobacter sp. N42]|uniref:N-acetylmuramoyl-L-alanine amidase n=1 Tax=Lysobacter sp. N42 TaxID=2545719 RepID=UPI00104A3608|nr:N-acetylmuramoyl-L-alanine amidase [Lysobacter sp. N42]
MPVLPDLPPLPVNVDPLPYEARLERRPLSQVDLVVIHCTEVPDLAMARAYGEKVLYEGSGTGNSGHYYIDRDGSLHRYVAVDRIANHTRGYNPRSIGIELVNTGRYPRWYDSGHQAMDEPYTPAQIDTLVALLQRLAAEYPTLRWIAGHEDLDTAMVEATDDPSRQVRRKRDPGPLFPWSRVLAGVPLQRLNAPAP